MADLVRKLGPSLSPLVFVALWMAISLLVSRVGGWHRLAAKYRHSGMFSGKILRFRSGSVNIANYNGCLMVGTDSRGIYLAPLFLFRPGHPPLYIPWGEISVDRETSLWRPYAALRFPAVPGVTVRLPGSLWDRIEPGGSPGKGREGEPFLPSRIEPR